MRKPRLRTGLGERVSGKQTFCTTKEGVELYADYDSQTVRRAMSAQATFGVCQDPVLVPYLGNTLLRPSKIFAEI